MIDVTKEEDKLLVDLHNEFVRKGRLHLVSVRAYQIVDFSSQYGTEDSLSYSAENFLGPPAIYPRSGDHAYSYQFRTYGQWWKDIPSYPKTSINLPYGSYAESEDFLEFRVERRIVPVLMRIYEIYNPGAIVRIFIYCYDTERWITLWQGEPEVLNSTEARCLSLTFKDVNYISDYYRLEFHHKHLKYFCQLDGLILYGEERYPLFFPMPTFQKFPIKEVTNSLVNIPRDQRDEGVAIENYQSYFNILPEEIITIIMSFLDLKTLCIASTVSRSFKKFCYEPLLYKEISLQLYWPLVDATTLKGLQTRLTCLNHLNISWCGGQGRITPPYFIEFLEASCKYLSVLKISCCPFVNNNCIKALVKYSPDLKVLEMRCCRAKDLTQSGFRYISQMTKLMYLDLYRTHIDLTSILAIIRNCSHLEHLFLGSCVNIGNFDEVAQSISKYLKYIKTIDFWRGISLTCLGISELAEHCHDIVELDVGWCHKVDANCGCLRQLICHNRNLKKLFLTAIRTVSNNEVNTVADYCKDIEQLDLLGTYNVNTATIQRLLETCSKLKLLDVSFSDNAVKLAVSSLQERFPNVEIKCSVTPEMNF